MAIRRAGEACVHDQALVPFRSVSGPSRPDTHPQAPERRAWEARRGAAARSSDHCGSSSCVHSEVRRMKLLGVNFVASVKSLDLTRVGGS